MSRDIVAFFLSLSGRCARDTKAALLPILALAAVPLVVIAGAGIDYGRAISQREILVNALDAAGLSIASQLSASVMTDEEIDLALRAAFLANLSSLGYTETALENLTFKVDAENGVVDISSQIAVPSYFIHIGGIGPESITLDVATEVNYSRFDVELALVLDATGSMGPHIGTLKQASIGLLDTLIPDTQSTVEGRVRISVVPYSQGVNLGSYAETVSNGNADYNCVTERVGEAQYTDAPYDYTPNDEDLVVDTYFGGGSTGCPSNAELLPLTKDRDEIEGAINSMSASGATAGQTGIAWGWFTLSPNWSGLWPGDSEPASYDDDDVLKFAVVMTDGDFNLYYDPIEEENCTSTYGGWNGSWGDWGGSWGDRGEAEEICETVYKWKEEREGEYYGNTPSNRGVELCEAMKNEGITVYSIYFGSRSSSSGARVMSDCASDSSSFYMANSSSGLINAFGNIAKKIQAIYLAK